MPSQTRTGLEKAGVKLGLPCRACGCRHLEISYLLRLPDGRC
jgi:hypothetical protein